ncbi:exosortase/archaeosortase family protein [Akkermansiaceae bacterium]|nr:exosortase/archaeosortase family protein [Akkermansiaceae bacterium]MDA7888642.1 exosortase/archaeosortase family protein [Akkermansiaceae bacterium]MDB4537906.1 exosortase/archaeosortase family protein [Akkermansiaceae bacterium]
MSFQPSTLAMGLGAIAVLLFMYVLYPAYPTTPGRNLAKWTWMACNSQNGFLHGRFIPVAFCVMIWIAWKSNRREEISPSSWGLVALSFGLLLYVGSIRTIQPRLALIGVPFVVVGLTHYCFGWKIAKAVIFPAFFFWFSIPVPGLETLLTGRLQILITKLCYELGLFLGMDLISSGEKITVRGTDLEIAPGCSGIRSLMALVMIAAVYANYTQKKMWKKAVLFAASFPLAIIGNFGRIFTILILAQFGMGDFGTKTWHDWAGLLLFFPIALSGLYLVDYLLNFKTRRMKKVKRSVKRTTSTIEGTVVE